MAEIKSAIEDLAEHEDTVKRLAERELELSRELLQRRDELKVLEAGASIELAHADPRKAKAIEEKLSASISAAERGLKLLAGAIATVRDERRGAIVAMRRAQAGPLRAQAAAKRAEAKDLQLRSAPHLEALRELQAVDYGPIGGGPGGLAGIAAGAGRPLIIQVATSRSTQLLQEADALEQSAAATELEADRVPANGTVEASNLDGLVDAIFGEPARIGPPVPDVAMWVDKATARARQLHAEMRRRQPNAADEAAAIAAMGRINDQVGRIPPDIPPAADAPLMYSLTWRDGRIDEQASRALAIGGRFPTETAELEVEQVEVIGSR